MNLSHHHQLTQRCQSRRRSANAPLCPPLVRFNKYAWEGGWLHQHREVGLPCSLFCSSSGLSKMTSISFSLPPLHSRAMLMSGSCKETSIVSSGSLQSSSIGVASFTSTTSNGIGLMVSTDIFWRIDFISSSAS
ncbi:hypothetical protein Sjap_018481 [Stephania japonica]|uniref:Uncharacterized protein n=1 Tax=Stephania japonica TaxID=461633 RepID=A0AAP0I816_9MAGN